MRFLFPNLFFAWALVAVVPILLYLFRPQPKTVRTSTLPFFIWLAREHQDSAWLRRLKYFLSLLLTLLVILAASAALGRLVVSPPTGAVNTVIVLVDRSASMAVKDERGRSLLDIGLTRLRERLAGLPTGVGVVIMAYDQRAEVLLSRSLDGREVERQLATIVPRPMEGRTETALAHARQLAAVEPPTVVWHVTDHEPSEASNSPAEIAVEHLVTALPKPVNAGITAFHLRRVPLEKGRFEAFVQVRGSGPRELPVEVEVRLDGKPIALRKVELAVHDDSPSARETLLVPIAGSADVERVLTLTLSAPGDCLAADNIVRARVPKLRSLRVLWITESPDPFTELALSSLGAEDDVEVLQGSPSSWPPEKEKLPDVVIFDSWLPKEWPTQTPVIVMNPPGSAGPIQAVRIANGLPLDSVRTVGDGHPVLYGVATDRVALTQTATLATDGTLQPLWLGVKGPVLVAGEVAGQRVTVMAFSPQRSEQLPLMASYPLLIGNALYWSAEHVFSSAQSVNRRTGELVELEGRTLKWLSDGSSGQRDVTRPINGRYVELDRVGLWETDSGILGAAALLSSAETVLPANKNADSAASHEAAVGGTLVRGNLLPLFLWGILAVLIGESWLFHKYWVY